MIRKKETPRKYTKCDLILWKGGISCSEKGINRKLNRKFSGAYKIIKCFDGNCYKIKSVKGMQGYKIFSTTVAVDSLRPYRSCTKDTDLSSNDSDSGIRDKEELIDLIES